MGRRKSRRSKGRKGDVVFYNPKTKHWYRAKRLRNGRLKILGLYA